MTGIVSLLHAVEREKGGGGGKEGKLERERKQIARIQYILSTTQNANTATSVVCWTCEV